MFVVTIVTNQICYSNFCLVNSTKIFLSVSVHICMKLKHVSYLISYAGYLCMIHKVWYVPNVGAVQSRLSTLESYWTKFEEQNKILCSAHKDVLKRHEYGRTDVPSLACKQWLLRFCLLNIIDIRKQQTKIMRE